METKKQFVKYGKCICMNLGVTLYRMQLFMLDMVQYYVNIKDYMVY